MEQIKALIEGMKTRFISGREIPEKEKLAGHISTLTEHDVETLWHELKEVKKMEAANALRAAAAAFWSDTDTRTDDEKSTALLAAVVDFDNA